MLPASHQVSMPAHEIHLCSTFRHVAKPRYLNDKGVNFHQDFHTLHVEPHSTMIPLHYLALHPQVTSHLFPCQSELCFACDFANPGIGWATG